MKYPRRPNSSIDADYAFYLGQEGLYGILLGNHVSSNRKRKANYIWARLLEQYQERVQLEKDFIREQANIDLELPQVILPRSAKKPLCGSCKVELDEFYVCPKCMIQHSPGVLGTVEATSFFGAKSTWLDYKHGAVVYARKMRLQNAGVTVTWNGEIVRST